MSLFEGQQLPPGEHPPHPPALPCDSLQDALEQDEDVVQLAPQFSPLQNTAQGRSLAEHPLEPQAPSQLTLLLEPGLHPPPVVQFAPGVGVPLY